MPDRPLTPPPLRLFAMEQLAGMEFGAFLAASPVLRRVGRGDQHPVLVLPGFVGTDRSTAPLRWYLRGQGYWVHGWHLGRNIGPRPRIVDGLTQRLTELHRRHGRRVSLIGWSLGGIYAREVARADPGAVRQVITLGTPFRFGKDDRGSLTALYNRLNPNLSLYPGRDHADDESEPLEVPVTAIYSRADGIVRWHACIQSQGARRENIEVRGSHNGLGYNPAALFAISDRLAQHEDAWRPFRPPPGMGSFYPHPVHWDPNRRVPRPVRPVPGP